MRVTQLWRYPLKSAQGEPLEAAEAGPFGLEGDRQRALVDVETGRPLTGRREPKLLFLRGRDEDGDVVITTDEGRVLSSDTEISEWLGRKVELVPPDAVPSTFENPVDPFDESGEWATWNGPSGVWHDSTRTRISLISETSLRGWPVRRFRPNVVVDGQDETELVGHDLRIGNVVLHVTKLIDRCVMVTRPQPGLDRDVDVLKTVLRDHAGDLGIGALVKHPGTMAVGDPVEDLGPTTASGA